MKLFALMLYFTAADSFKPVVILHGMLSGAQSMDILAGEIKQGHPGTKVYIWDKFESWSSLENAWCQVNEFRSYLSLLVKQHSEGVVVIGYSQGGLIARAAIQTLPNHNVKTFISLSSPQAGQFGANFLHMIFPDLTENAAYQLFYSRIGQQTSVGNYWNDPHKQDLYLKFNSFLPFINNEIKSSRSIEFKNALLHLDKIILIGGPNDGVITPWQSSHFGYYNSSLDVIPFYKRSIYITDAIGLKLLEESGRLVIITKPFVHHFSWHTNRHIIQEVILSNLD